MTQEERTLFITRRKLTVQHIMTSEMQHELSQIFDNVQARFAHEVVKSFVDQMIETRTKDITIEEGPQFFDDTKFKLELFVFNREELNELINSIPTQVTTKSVYRQHKRFTDEWGNSDWRDTGEMGG